jgi:3-oxoadipate enol-lactonase
MVGMRLAISAPERIDRLVLACTSARFGTPAGWQARAALVRARGLEAVAHEALAKWFTPDFADVAPFLEMQLATPRADYALGLEAMAGFDVREELGAVRAPTFVIAGAEDTATTAADAEFLAEHIPGARLVLIEGAAHPANVEQADEFNEALLAHLDRSTTRTR